MEMVDRFCLNCGATAQLQDVFCSVCGRKIETGPWETWAESPSPSRGWYRGLAILAVAMTLGIFSLGAAGAYRGFIERTQSDRSAAQMHYARGLAYLEEGNYPLALAEFEEAVRLNPTDTEAQRQLLRARTLVESQAPSTSQALDMAAQILYQEAENFSQQGDFEGTIEKLEQLRRLAPQHRPQEAAEFLFAAYLAAGRAEVEVGKVDVALAHFDAALALRPEDEEATTEKELATLYLQAQSLWGSDWEGTVAALEELYTQNPQYADVVSLLTQAHLEWGSLFEEEGAWCLAEREYTRALELSPQTETRRQKERVAALCLDSVFSSPMINPTPSPAQ